MRTESYDQPGALPMVEFVDDIAIDFEATRFHNECDGYAVDL